MYVLNMASGCTHEETLFVSSDDLDNSSILLDEDNDLEEESTHLSNEVFLFSSLKKEKKHSQSSSKCTQNMYRNGGNLERIQVCFLI